ELGINQLGAVYEGLMSYTGFFAETDLYEVAKPGVVGGGRRSCLTGPDSRLPGTQVRPAEPHRRSRAAKHRPGWLERAFEAIEHSF
ncbi:hypothetical protein AB0B83_25155, partial [Micromonospora sp. NPDC049060]|uniref:hypothetical protein n=1 Tax=Micromonospora sp. NPDC049060 TaxID=3154828 RepID=UPI0033C29A48